MNKTLALLAAAVSFFSSISRADEVIIQLLGDSTIKRYADTNPKRGWGQFLDLHFDGSVKILNMGILGKSSKSYQTTELWPVVKETKANYWLIQFGHNDANQGEHRKTDPNKEFPENLRIFIAAARESGAKPVLVTPPPRRRYQADGQLTRELEPYAAAMKRIGAEDSVPVLDLNARAKALFEKLGEDGSEDLMAPDDRSHFSEKGARIMAGFVAEEIRVAIPELSSHLIANP